MKNMLIFCSGANKEVLAKCPTEVSKYCGIGGAVLLTAILATFTGGYFVFIVFASPWASLLFAPFWGLLIFNLDRLIVASMRRQIHWGHELLAAMPRIVLALLISYIIAQPLELRLFQSEIQAEIQEEQNRAYMDAKHQLDSDTSFLTEIQQLETENREVRATISKQQELRNDLYKAFVAEAEGTGGTLKQGRGPVFDEKKQEADKAEQELKDLRQNSEAKIQSNEHRLMELQGIKERKLGEFDRAKGAAKGILAQMKALHTLMQKDTAVNGMCLLITALLLALETIPILIKILAIFNRRRPYDSALEAKEAEAEAQASIDIFTVENWAETEIAILRDRNAIRQKWEKEAHNRTQQEIVNKQQELAKVALDIWYEEEIDRIKANPSQYIQVS